LPRDIDQIVERVRQQIPQVEAEPLGKFYSMGEPHLSNNDGHWWFGLPRITKKAVQIESSDGNCPFVVKNSDTPSVFEADTANTVDEVVQLIVNYLYSMKDADEYSL
jgi:hypothetical protein